MKTVFKRLFAFIIDWFLTGVFVIISMLIFYTLSKIPGIIGHVFLIVMILSAIGILFVFFFRDAVFMGKTPGKKLFSLGVYDADTFEVPSQKKLFVKGLFTILFQIDGIILLVSKKSLGEMASNIAVLDKANLETLKEQRRNPKPYMVSQEFSQFTLQSTNKQRWKTILKVVSVTMFVVLILSVLSQIVLHSKKDLEECKLAYNYLVESETFEASGADESDVRMNRYSSSTYTNNKGEQTQTVTIGFTVDFKAFEVVCHNENDTWRVCDECTRFE